MLTHKIKMQLECLRYVRQKAFLSTHLGIPGWKESVEKILCKTSTRLSFWGCHQVTWPTDLNKYLETRSSLRALRSPVLQLHFCRRALPNLSPAVPSESLWILGEVQVVQLCISTANPLDFVSHALVRVKLVCRPPVMTPQTSFDRICHCGRCDGERSGCTSFLGGPPPCDRGHTIKWQWFSWRPHLCWQFRWCCLRDLGFLLPACWQGHTLPGTGEDTFIWSVQSSMSIFVSGIRGVRPLFSIRSVGRTSWVLESHQGLSTWLQKGGSGREQRHSKPVARGSKNLMLLEMR